MTGRPARELTPEETSHRDELLEHLRQQKGNVSAVAGVLGKHRTQVVRWLVRYQIQPHGMSEDS